MTEKNETPLGYEVVKVTLPDGTVKEQIDIDFDAKFPRDENYKDASDFPVPDNLTISLAEREKRLEIFLSSRLSGKLDGIEMSKEDQDHSDALYMKWVNGEITEEELDAAPRLICGKLVHI